MSNSQSNKEEVIQSEGTQAARTSVDMSDYSVAACREGMRVPNISCCYNHFARVSAGMFTRLIRRGGRVAEGGGLLNRYTVKSCIGGSNPPLSAST